MDDKQIKKSGLSANSGGGFSVLDDFQAMYSKKGGFKNQLDEIVKAMQATSGNVEREPAGIDSALGVSEIIREVPVSAEIEKKPELSGYIEQVEKAAELTHPVIDDYKNQVLLTSVNPQRVKISLPLDEEKIEEGLHHKAWEAIRWLAEWCLRQLKILKVGRPSEMLEV